MDRQQDMFVEIRSLSCWQVTNEIEIVWFAEPKNTVFSACRTKPSLSSLDKGFLVYGQTDNPVSASDEYEQVYPTRIITF